MRKVSAVLVAVLALAGVGVAQKNTFHADQFDASTVGARIGLAQAACRSGVTCVIYIDESLSPQTEGTLPTRCASCVWLDYRSTAGLKVNDSPAAHGQAYSREQALKDFTFGKSDAATSQVCTDIAGCTFTFPAGSCVSAVGSGWWAQVFNGSAVTLTLAAGAGNAVNGAASVGVTSQTGAIVFCEATGTYAAMVSGGAADSTVVHLTGNETIAGNKRFNGQLNLSTDQIANSLMSVYRSAAPNFAAGDSMAYYLFAMPATAATDTGIALQGDVHNDSNTVATTGHHIGVLGHFQDTSSGGTSGFGVEGRADFRSSAATSLGTVGVMGVCDGPRAASYLGNCYAFKSFVNITTDGTTPLAQGTGISYYAPAIVGGLNKYSFWAEDSSLLRNVTVLPSATVPSLSALFIQIDPPGSAGTRDSHAIDMRGGSFDTSGHTVDWLYQVNTTSNAGASLLNFSSRIDAGGFVSRAYITDGGFINAATGYATNGTPGLSQTVVVKGSTGVNCNLVFSGGLLTSTTCP